MNIILLILLGLACGAAGVFLLKKKAAQVVSLVTHDNGMWTRQSDISGNFGHYCPVVVDEGLKVFSNYDGTISGDFFRQEGNFKSVGGMHAVLSGIGYIRTAAVCKAGDKYYALLHVGDTYPSTTGYLPCLAISNDKGLTWNWDLKPLIPDYTYSSSSAMIVQPEITEIDHVNILNNKFVIYEDGYAGKKLSILYGNGSSWQLYDKDVWPVNLGGPVFHTCCKTPYGVHLISGNGWSEADGVTAHYHLFASDGINFKVLEEKGGTYLDGHKGTNLCYDDGTIHAITGTKGDYAGHWTLQSQKF